MLGVAHLEGEAGGGDPVAGGLDGRRQDVDVLVGQDAGDVRQQPGPVQRLDLDGDQEDRGLGGRPLDLEDALGLLRQRVDVDAVAAVHRDAAAAGDEADDRVAGHGRAAAGQLDPDVVDALDDHARVGVGCAACGAAARRAGRVSAMSSLAASSPPSAWTSFCTTFCAATWPSPIAAYSDGDVGVAHLVGEGDQGVAGEDALDRQVLLAHRARDGVLALLDRLVAALLGEPGADLVAGARRLDEAQPVAGRARAGRLGGEDLHQVAVVEGGLQRHEPPVDPGAYGAVADLGVHRVREVDRGGAGRQRYHVALGREDEDLVARQVEAQRLQELAGVLGLLLPVEQLAQPRHVVDGVVVLAGGPRARRCAPWRRRRRPPACTSSARRCRTRRGGACRTCGSGARRACRWGR